LPAVTPVVEATPTNQIDPPLVDAGGHNLWIECQGTGSPTVILEAGLGVTSFTWSKVMPGASQLTRVCRYDRAWLGQSLPGPLPRNSQVIANELHTLLANAKIEPPYILVGASFGGLCVQLYAAQHPQEVAGMVLVDSTHADLDDRIEAVITTAQAEERRMELGLNQEKTSFKDIQESDNQVRAAGNLPDVPLVVLRHGVPFEFSEGWPAERIEQIWLDLQTDLSKRTSKGRLVVAEKSGHRISETEPELVVAAIREVLEATRK
jgi:pimeloyl-ACP methyl ester carboxylesterase